MMLRAFSEGEGDFLKFRLCALRSAHRDACVTMWSKKGAQAKLPFLSKHILIYYRIIHTFYYQNALKVLNFVKCPPLIVKHFKFFL